MTLKMRPQTCRARFRFHWITGALLLLYASMCPKYLNCSTQCSSASPYAVNVRLSTSNPLASTRCTRLWAAICRQVLVFLCFGVPRTMYVGDLYPAEMALWEAFPPYHHLVPRVMVCKVPPRVEWQCAPVALQFLGTRGDRAAELTLH